MLPDAVLLRLHGRERKEAQRRGFASEQVKEPTRGHEKGIQVAAETVPVPGGTQKQDGAWE